MSTRFNVKDVNYVFQGTPFLVSPRAALGIQTSMSVLNYFIRIPVIEMRLRQRRNVIKLTVIIVVCTRVCVYRLLLLLLFEDDIFGKQF